ncbi:MAG TPA: hypothetical protein GXZ88_08795 [Firmicutes bacterium]|jgi:DNA replication protein DnaC|nr:hypothetical protein [Candidatus Fermentithermobacillaceae bacterium]
MVNELTAICKKLKLGDLSKFADQVAFENETQYLTDVLRLLLENREAQRVQRLIKQAKFPAIKTFEGYRFEPITWPKGFGKEQLLSLEFIEKKQNSFCSM